MVIKTVIANMTIEVGTPQKPAQIQKGQPFPIEAADPEDLVKRGIARDLTTEEAATLRPPSSPATGPVEIPANWQELNAADSVALARKLGAKSSVNRHDEAHEFIARIVAERAGAPS